MALSVFFRGEGRYWKGLLGIFWQDFRVIGGAWGGLDNVSDCDYSLKFQYSIFHFSGALRESKVRALE